MRPARRTRRSPYGSLEPVGRFLGTAVFSICVIALTLAIVTLYLALRIKIYPAGPLFAWSLRGFVAKDKRFDGWMALNPRPRGIKLAAQF